MSGPSESELLAALSEVTDPQTGRDLVASGRIKSITLGEIPRVMLEVPSAIARDVDGRLDSARARFPAVQFLLTAHRAAPEVKRRGQPHKPRRPEGYQGDANVKSVVAVASAKGGVGKSTVAVQLAFALARYGLRVGLLDADIHGPSVPLLTNTKGVRADTVEVEGRTLIEPLEVHGVKVLSVGHLTKTDGPIIWRGPLVHGAITRMVWDAHWGELDVLLIDMPPGTGDAQIGLAQDIKPRAALIVTTPQDLALEDARKGSEMFAAVDIPVAGTVLNMSRFTCPHCGESSDVFGSTEMESLAEIPLSLKLRRATERGEPWEDAIFDGLAERVKEMLP